MLGDVIDTFRNTAPLVYHMVAQKIQIEKNTCQSVSYSKSLSVNHVFLDLPFCGPMFQKHTQ